ncbi:hypothetical protein SEA_SCOOBYDOOBYDOO_15 [Mycobacterium phage ScoobyDoobyDoo]|nr:hypothetical protein SEA_SCOOBYDOOBYDOO_15 [Mycobacterium phage ScoobyDoobyDoo]
MSNAPATCIHGPSCERIHAGASVRIFDRTDVVGVVTEERSVGGYDTFGVTFPVAIDLGGNVVTFAYFDEAELEVA